MALNSIREQVINNVVTTLEGVESIAHVSRKRMTDLDELQSVPTTQLPYMSVTGGLPEPIQKQSGRRTGNVEVVKSILTVEIVCYHLAPVDPDTVLSNLLDDIWAALYAEQTRGGIALGTELIPQVEPVFIQPYILFRVVCNVTYLHDTTHI
jgi:hypothetical protein